MSDTLQLGLSESRRSAPGVNVQTAAHPSGNAGVALSVQKICEKIRQGRNDLRVRAWAGKALKNAGDPDGVKERAQAILDQLSRQTVYVQDPPGTELIQSAASTLCLDDKGFCLRAGDCDDKVVAYCSACMSIGIPCRVIIQAFNGSSTFTHVLCEVYDDARDTWFRVDPSTKMPVGRSAPATSEKRFDPMDGSAIDMTGTGEYIGVGRLPSSRLLALGAPPQAGASAPDPDIVVAVQGQVESAIRYLDDAANALMANLDALVSARAIVRGADNIFDPEGTPVVDIADFPSGGGVWTRSMDDVAQQFLVTCEQAIVWGQESLAGARRIYVDTVTLETKIESLSSDAFSLDVVFSTAKDSVIGIYERGKGLVGGITTKLGKLLSPAEIAQAKSSGTLSGAPIGVSGPEIGPIVAFVAGAAAATAIAIGVFYALGKLADVVSTYLQETTLQDITKAEVSKNMTPDEAEKARRAVVAAREAQAKVEGARNPPSQTDWGSVAKWVAIGAGAIAVAVVASPIVNSLASRPRKTA